MNHADYCKRWRQKNKRRIRQYAKQYRLEHEEKQRSYSRKYHKVHKKERSEYNKSYRSTLQGRIKHWRQEAKRKGVKWNLTQSYLEQIPLVCAYSGIPLTLEPRKSNTVSLDRIDGARGYIPNNVVFSTYTVNVMKWNQSPQEFINLCKQIIEHHDKSLR